VSTLISEPSDIDAGIPEFRRIKSKHHAAPPTLRDL